MASLAKIGSSILKFGGGGLIQTGSSSGFVLKTASNTGLLGAGVSEVSLTNVGSATYNSSFNGQTISLKKFTDVTVTGTNITFDRCLFEFTGGSYSVVAYGAGAGLTLVDCTGRCTSTSTGAEWFIVNPDNGCTIRRCDLSGAENIFTCESDNHLIEDSFLHYPSSANPLGHNDVIEIYGGNGTIIRRNTIILDDGPGIGQATAPINVAPFSGSINVSNLDILDNYIDGNYWAEILLDSQQAGTHTLTNIRVLRNRFGGHNGGGDYGTGLGQGAFQNYGMTRVATDTAGTDEFYCPYTGADANYWDYCTSNPFGFADLSPDRSGVIYAGPV